MKKGTQHSPKSRQKISASKIGKGITEEHRLNISKGKKGQGHSKIAKAKIGRAMRKPIIATRIKDDKKIQYQSIEQACKYLKVSRLQFWRAMRQDQVIKNYKISYLPKK